MHVTDHFASWSDKMAARVGSKRGGSSDSSTCSSSTSKKSKRQVSVATFESGSGSMIATIKVYFGYDVPKTPPTDRSFQRCGVMCADNTRQKSQE